MVEIDDQKVRKPEVPQAAVLGPGLVWRECDGRGPPLEPEEEQSLQGHGPS